MEELTKILNELKLKSSSETRTKDEEIVSNLDSILQALLKEGSNRQALVEHLIQSGIVSTVICLLKSEKLSPPLTAKIGELIAELAKVDIARKPCTDVSMVGPLVDLLSSEDNQTVLQVCRALANICYDNDVARNLVKEQHGVGKMVDLLRRLLKLEEIPDSLRNVASGCLLNLTDTYEVQESALQAGILDVLLNYLDRFHQDEDVATHCLLVLNCLADCDAGRNKLMEKPILSSLMNILGKNITEDVMESLLELFGNLAECDSVKLQLAELGLCDHLLIILKRSQGKPGEEHQSIVKMVCDLVVLILTGDASMDYLYNKGQGSIYKESLMWLMSTDDNLQIAGSLAAGNFARKDEHCIQMVKDGVPKHLLLLLQNHSGKDGDIRLQHAILSALRNLSIPLQNKPLLIELGVVEKILPMVDVETFPVVFKLLGTIRMLVDKQDKIANSLGENIPFIQRLIGWCTTEDHPGVKGESTRLLAWLVKNCSSKTVLMNLLKENALPYLVNMLNSEHEVMQNEALTALLIVASDVLSEAEKMLREAELLKMAHQLLKHSNDSVDILDKLLALFVVLASSEMMKLEMQKLSICDDITTLTDHSNSNICDKAQKVLNLLKVP
ncbi:rap1 GTPase-GDP dissociation stimulator 1-like isoform X2 [Centruroides vittatus]|uniref:rap1 GTPase-GDP dissociation stimulator 1-like isoform X2 n=1 Tax=Centruroides vittatus TaxID=120091 RepID=UPI00350F4455